jgi:Tfp pilus assembly protein PilX
MLNPNPTSRVRQFRIRRDADERGSLVIVLAILFVVALLSTTVFVRVMSDFNNTNYETNLQRARAMAESGVSDALFQIDQRDGSPQNFCNAPLPQPPASPTPNCSPLTSIPGAPGAQYTATWSDITNAYTVLSRGTVRGVTYAVKAVISAEPELNSALTGTTVTFNGNSFKSINVTGANGLPLPGATANISVASGGTLTCNGGSSPNADYLEYLHSSTNCTPAQALSTDFLPKQPSISCPAPPNLGPLGEDILPPVPCMPGYAQPCPEMMSPSSTGLMTGDQINGYTISGGTTAAPAVLEPGVYVCYGGLTMNGVVNVDYTSPLASANNGRIQIYMFGPHSNPQSISNLTLDTGGGTTINGCEVGTPTPGNLATNCVSGTQQVVGDPVDLQIFMYGAGNVTIGNNLNSINAVLWAPLASLNTNGAAVDVTWTGAVVLGTVNTNGQPATFLLNYDERLATEFQNTVWQITSYLQTSPNFSIPNY